jgi:hypothetical protein
MTRRMLAASRTDVQDVQRRLTQLSSAVELLTDTTESGLQAAFAEIQHLTNASAPKTTQRGLQTRVRKAARRGRSAREIAVREGVSEGEVRLRLTLADAPSPVTASAADQPAAAVKKTRRTSSAGKAAVGSSAAVGSGAAVASGFSRTRKTKASLSSPVPVQ